MTSMALVTYAGSPNRRCHVGHRFAICHSVPALGEGDRLGLRLWFVGDHDPCARGFGLIEVKHVAQQLFLRGHGRKRSVANQRIQGSLDDVAIYTEALPEDEVEAHHAISEAPPLTRVLRAPRDLTDTDEDEMPDEFDNCPEAANPEQEDADGNGVGDACEVTPDTDEDGVPDETDNCPMEANALQEDENENGIGDVCEIEEEEGGEEEGE